MALFSRKKSQNDKSGFETMYSTSIWKGMKGAVAITGYRVCETLFARGIFFWKTWDTPLTEYAYSSNKDDRRAGVRPNFEECAEQKMREGTTDILDVGWGSGRQWIGFEAKNGNMVRITGTASSVSTTTSRAPRPSHSPA